MECFSDTAAEGGRGGGVRGVRGGGGGEEVAMALVVVEAASVQTDVRLPCEGLNSRLGGGCSRLNLRSLKTASH